MFDEMKRTVWLDGRVCSVENLTHPLTIPWEISGRGRREVLDRYRRFYWLGHFEGLLSWDLHLVDIPSVELDVLHELVVGLGPYHETAIAVYLFRQFLRPSVVRVCS